MHAGQDDMTAEETLDAIMAVMESSFDPHWREAWTRSQVSNSLVLSHTHAILVDRTGEPPADPAEAAGFVLSRRAPGEEELLLIGVRPEWRRSGLGTALLERFVASAKEAGAEKVFLEMRAGNPAEALYRRAGFAPIGERRDYYTTLSGEKLDAITFAKPV